MGILQQKVKVKITNFNMEYYKKYFPLIKAEDVITIPINQLSKGSGIKITVQCDYCGVIFEKAYRRIFDSDDICCTKCRYIKIEHTNLQKYGTKCSLHNEVVQQKAQQTCLRRFGTKTALENKEIRNKCTQTMVKKYGQPYTLQVPELRKKTQVNISKPQAFLQQLYGGILNFSLGKYYLDMYFPDEKIAIEYDGGGHNLSVIRGHYTQEEFLIKEEQRAQFLQQQGVKIFRLISADDILPTEEILLQLKKEAFSILLNENYYIFSYNLNTKQKIIS